MLAAWLADGPKYKTVPVGLDVEVGWWAFALGVGLVIWACARAPWVRRMVFGREDPRIFALLRIALAICTFGCIYNLQPYWRMLLSDEGVFTLTEARQRLARSSLSGWTTEDGFLDGWAVAKFLWNKPSLLYMHGSPGWVEGYMTVFFAALGVYALGFRTRITGLVCFMMLNGIYVRNALYMEGTDVVYRVLWFSMLFTHAGESWSIDARLRRWRARATDPPGRYDLRTLGDRLLTIGWAVAWLGTAAHFLGLDVNTVLAAGTGLAGAAAGLGWVEARADRARAREGRARPEFVPHRLVSRWPRIIIMLQYAALYCNTGAVKTGGVWQKGDALFYALNLDHFYRFDGFTQWISAWFGTNLFRLATHVVHFWEIAFPLLLVGMAWKYALDHGGEAWTQISATRRWVGRCALGLVWLALYRITIDGLPYFVPLDKEGNLPELRGLTRTLHVGFLVGVPLLTATLWALGRRPLRVGPIHVRRFSFGPVVVDRAFVRRWLLGRRLWLGLGVAFHAFLFVFMNIGMFPIIMVAGYLGFTSARPWLEIMQTLARVLRKRGKARWTERVADALDRAAGPAEHVAPDGDRSAEHRWPVFDVRRFAASVWAVLSRNLGRYDLARADAARFDAVWPPGLVWVFAAGYLGLVAARAAPPELVAEFIKPAAMLTAGIGVVASMGAALRRTPSLSALGWGCTGAALVLVGIAMAPPVDATTAREYAVEVGDWARMWSGLALLVGVGFAFVRRVPAQGHAPSGGGPLSRVVVLGFMLWHTGAVGTTLTPSLSITRAVQTPSRQLFGGWLVGTRTNQSWRMFAPNPPRANAFMRTVVVDHEDRFWDLNNNAWYSRPNPFWINDRMRKMQRRMIGKGKWYLQYWANFHCRDWTLRTGEIPKRLEVYRINTRMPKPESVYRRPWNARQIKRRQTHVKTVPCGETAHLPDWMKERYGLEIDDADRKRADKAADAAKRRAETTRRGWERRRDWGGEPAPPRPRPSPSTRPAATRPPAQGRPALSPVGPSSTTGRNTALLKRPATAAGAVESRRARPSGAEQPAEPVGDR
jgi:hypothetical protein